MEFLEQLSDDTLLNVEKSTILDKKLTKGMKFNRQKAKSSITSMDNEGVKQLTQMLNKLELESICNDYLQVDHKNNNPHNKQVLTKRLMESFEEEGLSSWFKKCKDIEILRVFALVLGLSVPKDEAKAMALIQKEAPAMIRSFGFTVILNRLSTDDLHDICEDMSLKNHENTNSRKALMTGILTLTDIVVPESVRARTLTKKPAKKAIEKCTEYEQLYQHYFLDQLVDWCRENGVKTSGSKKIVINRILAYLGGDRENTMAEESRGRRRSVKRKSNAPEDEDDSDEGEEEEEDNKEEEEAEEQEDKKQVKKKGLSDRSVQSKKGKEAAKDKKAPVVAKKNVKAKAAETKKDNKKAPAAKKDSKKDLKKKKEEEEEEEEEEEVEETQSADEHDNENEEMTVDAERALRTNDDEENEENDAENESAEEEAEDEEEEEEEEEDSGEGIKGVVFCLTGKMSTKRETIVKAIIGAGGKVVGSITKEVNVLIAEDPDAKSQKLEKARQDGVKVVGEDYLKKFISY